MGVPYTPVFPRLRLSYTETISPETPPFTFLVAGRMPYLWPKRAMFATRFSAISCGCTFSRARPAQFIGQQYKTPDNSSELVFAAKCRFARQLPAERCHETAERHEEARAQDEKASGPNACCSLIFARMVRAISPTSLFGSSSITIGYSPTEHENGS